MNRNRILSTLCAGAMSITMFAGMMPTTVTAESLVDTAGISALADAVNDDGYSNPNKVPKQYNVHMGDDPSTQVNVTYTTLVPARTQIVLNKQGETDTFTFEGDINQGSANKYFHSIAVNGLEPNTTYEYKVGYGENTQTGKFKTALESGSNESFKFVYLADTQVSNGTTAKALGATLAEVNSMNPDYVYIAGDVTDKATNEDQWEYLFNNSGKFAAGGQDMFSNLLLSVTQGNHDNNTMNSHINAPAEAGEEAGKIVYSYDYGSLTFITLNLEAAKSDATARAKQKEYLTECVNDAKARGQWVSVGFHKSIYTGASHITDSDIVEARKYWSPIFAELDVDMVLQGHDHVYSRGFVNANGENAGATADVDGKIENPSNAPLYMVGGHAGGLKWYSKINYTVGEGDPLTTNYSFLDVNSTDTGSDVNKEQVIVELEVSPTEITVNCWMFKYDTDIDEITTEKYLYDTFTIKRSAVSGIDGPEEVVADDVETVDYTVSYDRLVNANAFKAEVEYDEDVLEFVGVESELNGVLVNSSDAKDGVATAIIGIDSAITSESTVDALKFVFKIKDDAKAGDTTIKLINSQTVTSIDENNSIDVTAIIENDTVITNIYTYKSGADLNEDGVITLADLSIALNYYQTAGPKGDVNLDKVVDVEDFLIIIGFIQNA